MSRTYDIYIYQQLEPESILITGKQKREPSAIQTKHQFDADYIAKHGLKAWQDMMAEYRQWEQDKYK